MIILLFSFILSFFYFSCFFQITTGLSPDSFVVFARRIQAARAVVLPYTSDRVPTEHFCFTKRDKHIVPEQNGSSIYRECLCHRKVVYHNTKNAPLKMRRTFPAFPVILIILLSLFVSLSLDFFQLVKDHLIENFDISSLHAG